VLWRPPALWLRGLAGSLSLLCTFYAYSSLRPSEVLALSEYVSDLGGDSQLARITAEA
jgi:hypothetical protein